MVNVKQHDYTTLSSGLTNERVQKWNMAGLSKMLPIAMVSSNKESDPTVAQAKAAVIVEELKDLFSKGVTGDWSFGVVVAQKPAS